MSKFRSKRLGFVGVVGVVAGLLWLSACGDNGSPDNAVTLPSGATPTPSPTPTPAPAPKAIVGVQRDVVATFDAPWAMRFLPDGTFLLSERDKTVQAPGKLWLVRQDGTKIEFTGLPTNTGILDIVLDPDFSNNRRVYIAFIEPGGPGTPRVGRDAATLPLSRKPEGLAVFRAELSTTGSPPSLQNVDIIWRQQPKIVADPGSGEPGGYLTFSPDGRYLFITAGDRQEFGPVQDLSNTLGKIVRIYPDGTIPADNPFVGQGSALPEIWTLGHRNQYGLAFNADGNLWEHENGPEGGDAFNLIEPGGNYGWPLASNGRNYGATTDDIPDHTPGDGFVAPVVFWTPSIAPSGMIFYTGDAFAAWKGDAIIGAMAGHKLVRLHVVGKAAQIVQNIDMPNRVRSVAQAPDGALWIIEDAPTGGVVKLSPVYQQ